MLPRRIVSRLFSHEKNISIRCKKHICLDTTRFFSTGVDESTSLRIGIVGLGAIGTIFFTKLAELAVGSFPHGIESNDDKSTSPNRKKKIILNIDAFVKERHLLALHQNRKVALYEKQQTNASITDVSVLNQVVFPLESRTNLEENLTYKNVRIRSLEGVDPKVKTNEQEQLDIILLTVKAFDSIELIKQLTDQAHLLKPKALVVVLQNGMGNIPEEDEDNRNKWHFVHGVTFLGGRVLSLGQALVSGKTGQTFLAPFEPRDEDNQHVKDQIRTLGSILTAAGLEWEVLSYEKMQAMLWKKLIVNASINPIASLLNAPNQSVADSEWTRENVERIVNEAYSVGKLEGIDFEGLGRQEMVEYVLQVARNTGGNVCSMLADLRKGSRTEIDAINGKVIELGHKHGLDTPCNSFVHAMIKTLQERKSLAPL